MKHFLSDKRVISLASVLLALVILAVFGIRMFSSQTKELQYLRGQQHEMAALKDEFLSLQQKIQSVENKKHLANVQGVLQAIDEVFSSVGLGDKIKTVKSVGKKKTKDGVEEEADISVEKVTMNEMANIFYRMEHAPMILTIKKVTLKQSFENPELLNINLLVSFLKTG